MKCFQLSALERLLLAWLRALLSHLCYTICWKENSENKEPVTVFGLQTDLHRCVLQRFVQICTMYTHIWYYGCLPLPCNLSKQQRKCNLCNTKITRFWKGRLANAYTLASGGNVNCGPTMCSKPVRLYDWFSPCYHVQESLRSIWDWLIKKPLLRGAGQLLSWRVFFQRTSALRRIEQMPGNR